MPLINFSGIASGIDSEALIEATSEAARIVRVNPHKRKIQELEDTNTAFGELKGKLSTLRSLLQNFASTAGGPLTKSATSSDETVLRVSAANSAANGSYLITVSQLAKNGTQTIGSNLGDWASADAVFSPFSPAEPLFDTLTIQIGDPPTDTIEIEVNDATTLSQVAASINENTSNAVATIVNVGTISSPSYKLVITSFKTGTAEGTISISANGNLASDIDTDTKSEAADARFTISGVGAGIERPTNSITDIIPGLTLNLSAIGGPVTVTVADDADSTTAKVREFVQAYNDLVAALEIYNKITRDESGKEVKTTFGPLSLTSVDNNALTALRSAMTTSSYSAGSEIKIFADLGITTDSGAFNAENKTGGGTLKFDETVFKAALSKEPNSVNQILKNFGDTAGLTGGTIDQYIRFNGLIDVSVNSNKTSIDDLNKRIGTAEEAILKQEEIMRQRFARLESTIGKLQNQASALNSALSSLPNLY